MLKKINIGSGSHWFEPGWDILDNGSGSYKESWKNKGKCWDNNLKSNYYDLVLTSHMLEHVPHFRLEKTIAEFNRILKIGGTIRILVPSLRKAVNAYINDDKEFFASSSHYSDHMGIGASLVRVLISPGLQTIAISREMDEIFGGYAHLNSFDYEMLKTLLEKWGFSSIIESNPGKSKIKDFQTFQYLFHDGRKYDPSDSFVKDKLFLSTGKSWHFGGVDKNWDKQLIVEATKIKDEVYDFEKEYKFHKVGRLNSPLMTIKLKIFKFISIIIDSLYNIFRKTGLNYILKKIYFNFKQ